MDNIRFGAFVAQLRKEQGLTQKELADRHSRRHGRVSHYDDPGCGSWLSPLLTHFFHKILVYKILVKISIWGLIFSRSVI